jgi:uncharacterized protein involved in outer membrane biogenesis
LVQTTLLGLGIAVILALLTALIGPLFIDWTHYRTAIEAEASRIMGAPVRIAGTIDVRLLPTPSLNIKSVQLNPAGTSETFAARSLAMEFGLGTLMRGEIRATEATIEGPELTIGLDRSGVIQLPARKPDFDLDRLSFDRLTVENGRITFTDAASGGRLLVNDVKFSGEVRSLLGPFKAEGSFAADDQHYNFRLSGSRRGEDGGMKLHLGVDAAERALTLESDGTLWVQAGSPRYEGGASLSRVVGTTLPGGRATINDPWKVTGKLKATAAGAAAQELDVQYGPDIRSLHLTGSAVMNFGHEPRVSGTFNARQIDLDRVLGGAQRKPLPADLARSVAANLASWGMPSLPMRIGLAVDSVTLGGSTLAGLRGDIEGTAAGWSLDSLELRAPGATSLQVAGKLAMADQNLAFDGPVKIDSSDPTAFFAWIEGRSAADRPPLGPIRGSGNVTLAGDRIAIDGLAAEVDRKPLRGRLAYRFSTATMPARLDATLRATDIDFDRAIAVGNALLASTSLDRPGEIALAVDIDRAIYAGIEARQAHAVLSFDATGLKIEHLSVTDIGGASIEASGHIDTGADAARGSIALTLAAPRLDGIAALADRFYPPASDVLRKYGARVIPLRFNARLDAEPRRDGGVARTAAKLKLDGRVAGIDVNLDASGTGDVNDPTAATVRLDGRLDAAEARTLAAFIGLDALVNADSRPARVTFEIEGTADRNFRVDGKFTGTDIAASASGTLASSGNGTLDVGLRAADARLPRRAGAVPIDLHSHVAIDGGTVSLGDLSGKLAGADVKGALTLGLGPAMTIDGRIEADKIDAAELTALFTGTPRPAARSGQALEWPAEPFAPNVLPTLTGRVEFRAAAARWAALTARQLAGAVRFEPQGFSFSDVTGMLADGRLALDAGFRRDPIGLAVTSQVKLVNADISILLAGALRTPAAGRVSLDVEAQGQGLSAASLIGALKGAGTMTIERAEIAGLDPTAIDAVIGALEHDRGLAANPGRMADIANSRLDAGRLRLPFAAAPLTIGDGRVQLPQLVAPAQNADLAATVTLGLNDGTFDARITMTGPQRPNAAVGQRPQMSVAIRGPLTAARRSVDVASLASWVTMQRVEQEAKRLDEAEKQQQRRIEAAAEPAPRRPTDGTAPATPEAGAAQASTGNVPAAPEVKPAPVRRPPPPPSPPSQPKPFNLLDLLPNGMH